MIPRASSTLTSSRLTCPGLNKLLDLRPDRKAAKPDVLNRPAADAMTERLNLGHLGGSQMKFG